MEVYGLKLVSIRNGQELAEEVIRASMISWQVKCRVGMTRLAQKNWQENSDRHCSRGLDLQSYVHTAREVVTVGPSLTWYQRG